MEKKFIRHLTQSEVKRAFNDGFDIIRRPKDAAPRIDPEQDWAGYQQQTEQELLNPGPFLELKNLNDYIKTRKTDDWVKQIVWDWDKYTYYIGNRSADGLLLQDFLILSHKYDIMNNSGTFEKLKNEDPDCIVFKFGPGQSSSTTRNFTKHLLSGSYRIGSLSLVEIQPADIGDADNLIGQGQKIYPKANQSKKPKHIIGVGYTENTTKFIVSDKSFAEGGRDVEFFTGQELFDNFITEYKNPVGQYRSAFKPDIKTIKEHLQPVHHAYMTSMFVYHLINLEVKHENKTKVLIGTGYDGINSIRYYIISDSFSWENQRVEIYTEPNFIKKFTLSEYSPHNLIYNTKSKKDTD